jgi:hypothetical protein
MEPVNNSPTVPATPVAPLQPIVNQTPTSPQTPKRKSKLGMIISLLIILFLLCVSGAAGYAIFKNLQTNNQEVACTMEALICPDGSSVERTGPNCEFAPCPTSTPDPTADWKTYEGEGFSFIYPVQLTLGSATVARDNVISSFSLSGKGSHLNFFIQDNSNNLTSEELHSQWKEDKSKCNNECDNFSSSPENINVDGRTGILQHVVTVIPNYTFYLNLGDNKALQVLVETTDSNGQITNGGDSQNWENYPLPASKQLFIDILKTFKFTDQTPTPTCTPRPACLDATPRCLMPEPANGWCP